MDYKKIINKLDDKQLKILLVLGLEEYYRKNSLGNDYVKFIHSLEDINFEKKNLMNM